MGSTQVGGRRGPEVRWWRTRRGFATICMFVAPVALLVFEGNVAAVLLVYVAVCVEGTAIVLLATSRVQSRESDAFVGNHGGSMVERGKLAVDRAGMLFSYVKSAAKGSSFSRAEIARTIMRIQERMDADSQGSPNEARDNGVAPAMRTVVQRYWSDPIARHGDEGSSDERAVQAGRREYLASLEEVVSELETRMNR